MDMGRALRQAVRGLVVLLVGVFLLLALVPSEEAGAVSIPQIEVAYLAKSTNSLTGTVRITSTGSGQEISNVRYVGIRMAGSTSGFSFKSVTSSASEYSVSFSGLAPRTTYEVRGMIKYRASSSSSWVEAYSASKTVTTNGAALVQPPVVVSTTSNSATFTAKIVDDGGVPPIKKRGFWIRGPNSFTSVKYDYVNAIGDYTLTSVANLKPNTEYTVHAEVQNGFSTMTTTTVAFKTKPLKPVVTTNTTSMVLTPSGNQFSATLQGSVTDPNGVAVTERGFVYGLQLNPATTVGINLDSRNS